MAKTYIETWENMKKKKLRIWQKGEVGERHEIQMGKIAIIKIVK